MVGCHEGHQCQATLFVCRDLWLGQLIREFLDTRSMGVLLCSYLTCMNNGQVWAV